MFQTIDQKGGFVQLSTFGNITTIKAWSHGELLGDKYTTIAGAKAAITRHHKAWVRDRQRGHHNAILAIVGR